MNCTQLSGMLMKKEIYDSSNDDVQVTYQTTRHCHHIWYAPRMQMWATWIMPDGSSCGPSLMQYGHQVASAYARAHMAA